MSDTDFYSDEALEPKKREFAAALMRSPLDPVKAAYAVESRVTHINHILNNWQYDPLVNEYMAEIRDRDGLAATIPTKEEFAATLYHEGQSARSPDTKLDFYKLFADVMGYIEKGKGTVINNNNSVFQQRNVLVMPQQLPAEDMEDKLIEYQRELTVNVGGN